VDTDRTEGAKIRMTPVQIPFVLFVLFVANGGMPLKPSSDDEAPKKLSSYTIKLDDAQM
jgi:hypothetical protein